MGRSEKQELGDRPAVLRVSAAVELTLTSAEAAKALDVSPKQLSRLIAAGRYPLTPARVRRLMRFSAADVARAARQK